MAYSDFTLSELKKRFQLVLMEVSGVFNTYPVCQPAPWLISFLAQNVPLALAINTEKARSELIIAPVLVELRNQLKGQISLFSGTEFNVDSSIGLNGRVDFLLSRSSEQLVIEAPVAAIVEAKNENLNLGIPQCIAELIAASRFNEQQGNRISPLYGVVTTGNLWKFMQLKETTVTLDLNEYHLEPVEGILGILAHLVRERE
jgi:hypothetical protein